MIGPEPTIRIDSRSVRRGIPNFVLALAAKVGVQNCRTLTHATEALQHLERLSQESYTRGRQQWDTLASAHQPSAPEAPGADRAPRRGRTPPGGRCEGGLPPPRGIQAFELAQVVASMAADWGIPGPKDKTDHVLRTHRKTEAISSTDRQPRGGSPCGGGAQPSS